MFLLFSISIRDASACLLHGTTFDGSSVCGSFPSQQSTSTMNRAQISIAYSPGQLAHYYPPERHTTLFCLNKQTAMRHLNGRCWGGSRVSYGSTRALHDIAHRASENAGRADLLCCDQRSAIATEPLVVSSLAWHRSRNRLRPPISTIAWPSFTKAATRGTKSPTHSGLGYRSRLELSRRRWSVCCRSRKQICYYRCATHHFSR